MFSETYTGTCSLPLWTAIVRPMKSGMMVERRDQVLIGFLSLAACAASTFFTRWASQNGPFFNERVMCYPLFLAAARDDHGSRALVAARLLTLRLLAPRRHWFTTTPRTVGRTPRQRIAPALPILRRLCSALPTSPTVARHSMCTRRTSPERRRT